MNPGRGSRKQRMNVETREIRPLFPKDQSIYWILNVVKLRACVLCVLCTKQTPAHTSRCPGSLRTIYGWPRIVVFDNRGAAGDVHKSFVSGLAVGRARHMAGSTLMIPNYGQGLGRTDGEVATRLSVHLSSTPARSPCFFSSSTTTPLPGTSQEAARTIGQKQFATSPARVSGTT